MIRHVSDNPVSHAPLAAGVVQNSLYFTHLSRLVPLRLSL
ncbi:hypothetical protein BBR47_16970 [Brevibacillus brevis NBRC 100599]|uniref:Uncharacterized protein n=1 Tax=Brevibacillus brevis (strain 47 / JCM 6285 / NBRC 100599) TaxID=358681 RepID=C0Z9K4_BREBN|nr:hypothetical protein BBR47_16970 [Brevibacillus brevis NBRC 100599]